MHQSADYRANILIVDDIPSNIDILSSILGQVGYHVMIAYSGQSALVKSKNHNLDLIMLDILMPDIDGLTVCKQLKENPQTQDIPVIFMTGLSEIKDKVAGFEVGAADYITKPIQYQEVLARVNTHISIYQLQKQLKEEVEHSNQLTQTLKTKTKELEYANKILEKLANIDGLTCIANRRCLDLHLEKEWANLVHKQKPLALLLIDIDHFKLYNDHYGHQAGDECLQMIANTIEQSLSRPTDLVGRYGGEEFMVLLPNTMQIQAIEIANTIQNNIQYLNIPHIAASRYNRITASIGITSITLYTQETLEQLIEAADKALYSAKNTGRNRTCYLSL